MRYDDFKEEVFNTGQYVLPGCRVRGRPFTHGGGRRTGMNQSRGNSNSPVNYRCGSTYPRSSVIYVLQSR